MLFFFVVEILAWCIVSLPASLYHFWLFPLPSSIDSPPLFVEAVISWGLELVPEASFECGWGKGRQRLAKKELFVLSIDHSFFQDVVWSPHKEHHVPCLVLSLSFLEAAFLVFLSSSVTEQNQANHFPVSFYPFFPFSLDEPRCGEQHSSFTKVELKVDMDDILVMPALKWWGKED